MTITRLIEQLEEARRAHGDLEVNVQEYRSFTCHRFGLEVDNESDPNDPRLLIRAQ